MRLPSHTTVVAYVALFVAVATGGAYAISVQSDSIKSRHLDENIVKRQHVANNAIGAEQLAQAPNGRMEGGAEHFESDPFTDAPVTYDTLDYGFPKDAFNLARGVFVAPETGSYLVTTQITWVDPNGIGRDARLIKLNNDGSPGATLIGPSHEIQGDGNQILNQAVRLKAGDTIQLTIANQGDNGNSTYAAMTINFISG